jgi:hypothetical protein
MLKYLEINERLIKIEAIEIVHLKETKVRIYLASDNNISYEFETEDAAKEFYENIKTKISGAESL